MPAKPRRFAEDTAVPVEKSTADIRQMLKAAGAQQTAVIDSETASMVMFIIKGRQYKLTVPIPKEAKDPAQEERRAWRLVHLLVKAKVEAVREGASTIEREFLADIIMPNGQTMAEYVEPQLVLAYEKGTMPKSLMLEGPR